MSRSAYRPSASEGYGGKWLNSKDKASLQRHDPDGHDADDHLGAALPEEVIWTVQYNTSTHGPNPTGVSGPADSLNVGTKTLPGRAIRGTDLNEDQIFVDSTYVGDGTSGWTGYRPLGAITTK